MMKQEEQLTFRVIEKNLTELEDSMKVYEMHENQKKNILTGMDRIVKSILKSNHSFYLQFIYCIA